MGVQQSGNVTPGHAAIWAASGVLRDGGALPIAQRVLAAFPSADFNDTGDQPLILPAAITAFQLTGIIITNASLSLTTAVGGFYPEAFKEGTPIVADTQGYSSLTTAQKLLQATLASFGSTTRFSRTNLPDWAIYFALTTPQGAAATADIYLIGIDLTL